MCDSEELEWELFELFETGLFAFPIYEHRSARRIVNYLLRRTIADEEIADAIEDSNADLHLWLNHHGKNMVGEWVIAWLNECRDDYEKEQALEIERIGYVGAYDDVTPELSYFSDDEGTSVEEEMRPRRRGPLIRQTTASTVELASSGVSKADTSTTHELSHQESLETELEFADDSDAVEDQYRECMEQQVPSIAYTHSQTNGNLLNVSDNDEEYMLRRGGQNRSFNKEHFREVVRYGTREKIKKLTASATEIRANHVNGINGTDESDDTDNYDFPPPPPPPMDAYSDTYSETFENVLDNMEIDSEPPSSDDCASVALPSCEDCHCTIPHYILKFPYDNGDIANVDYDYLELQRMDSADSLLDLYVSDNALRALEINIDTLELDGPGYMYIMSDIHDCLPWSEEHRYKVASSRNPERCLNELRSRNLNIDLIWQKKVEHHLKATKEVHETLRAYKLHSNWFRCSLSIIMKAVSVIVQQYSRPLSCSS